MNGTISPPGASPGFLAAQGATNTAATSSSSSDAQAASKELNADAFITLLMAQLKAQDPLNPMNPQEMMGQLTSLNMLQELIRIRQDLEKNAPAAPQPVQGTAQPAQGPSVQGNPLTNPF